MGRLARPRHGGQAELRRLQELGTRPPRPRPPDHQGKAGRSTQARAEKPKADGEKPKEDGEKPEDDGEKPEADAKEAEPKSREDNPAKEQAAKKPYVDRQLDKALAVIKEKLATPVAKK